MKTTIDRLPQLLLPPDHIEKAKATLASKQEALSKAVTKTESTKEQQTSLTDELVKAAKIANSGRQRRAIEDLVKVFGGMSEEKSSETTKDSRERLEDYLEDKGFVVGQQLVKWVHSVEVHQFRSNPDYRAEFIKSCPRV